MEPADSSCGGPLAQETPDRNPFARRDVGAIEPLSGEIRVDRSWTATKRSVRHKKICWFATRSGIVTAERDGYFLLSLVNRDMHPRDLEFAIHREVGDRFQTTLTIGLR